MIEEKGSHCHEEQKTGPERAIKFSLEKEMMLASFTGSERVKFTVWEFNVANFLSAGDYEHAADILELVAQANEDVDEDMLEDVAQDRGWDGQPRDQLRCPRYLAHGTE